MPAIVSDLGGVSLYNAIENASCVYDLHLFIDLLFPITE